MPYRLIFILLFSFNFLLISCQKISNEDGDLVARVYSSYLTKSELSKLFPASMIENDSLRVVESYIDRWVRDHLILYQAEKELEDITEINQLVEKYRSSLILLQYENMIIEKVMDTIISEEEMQNYYEKYKNQYVLSSPILKGLVFKIPAGQDSEKAMKTINKLKDNELKKWGLENTGYCITNPNNWYLLSDILGLLPISMVKKSVWKKDTRYETVFEETNYILYIEDYYDINDIPPFSFVANQAKQVILHQRRQNLVEQYNNEIYESHKKSRNVEIY